MKREPAFNEEEAKLKRVIPLLSGLGLTNANLHFEVPLRSRQHRHARFADIIVQRNGEAILLVETKSSRVNVRSSATLRQAIDYARTTDKVIPYALLSNGRDAVLVDVIEGKPVDPARATPLEGNLLAQLRVGMQRQALQRLGALDVEGLREFARTQLHRALQTVTSDGHTRARIVDSKYIPSLYVPRVRLDSAFATFVGEQHEVFAIVGDAGMGKTNSLCHLAEDVSRDAPVLLYHAASLGAGLREAICADFASLLGSRTFADIVQIVAAALQSENRTAFIFVDALNEFSEDRQQFRSELNRIAETTAGTPIRVVVSCRTLDWDFWIRNHNRMLGVFGRAVYRQPAGGGLASASVTLGTLEDAEFEQAWKRYKVAFRLSGSLSSRMQELCKEPFLLRLAAESYRDGKALPAFVEPLDLFQKYFEEKFPSTAVQVPARRFLFWMARQILQTGVPRIRLDDVPAQDMEWCERLVDENVILWRTGTHIQFHFELFLEFVVAQTILSDFGDGADVASRLAALKQLTSQELINMPGVVENLLLSWREEPELVRRGLEHLLTKEDRWKAIACSTIRKLAAPRPDLRSVIDRLARDDNPFIRTFAAQSAVAFVTQHGWDAVSDLVTATDWEARETAASIAAGASATNADVRKSVWRLADDYHWRVRRAAGYAMHQHRRRLHEEASGLDDLGKMLHSASWRQRYALSIAMLGEDLDANAASRDVVFALASDSNPQVRWGTANYLPRYHGRSVYDLVDLLSGDVDPWIRARAVDAAIRLSKADWQSLRPRLERLVQDSSPVVRVKLAREAQDIPDRSWVLAKLGTYMSDVPDVRFAAAYTLETLRTGGAAAFPARADVASQLRILRERVARRDLDPSTARFAAVRAYITRRTELSLVDDSYMSIIDTMSSLIASISKSMSASGRLSTAAFVDLLSDDLDEAVRWAVVLFVVRYGAQHLSRAVRLSALRHLAGDMHWWVRREVAIALAGYIQDPADRRWATALIRRMERAEVRRKSACKDEVLHFVRAALPFAKARRENGNSRDEGTPISRRRDLARRD